MFNKSWPIQLRKCEKKNTSYNNTKSELKKDNFLKVYVTKIWKWQNFLQKKSFKEFLRSSGKSKKT